MEQVRTSGSAGGPGARHNGLCAVRALRTTLPSRQLRLRYVVNEQSIYASVRKLFRKTLIFTFSVPTVEKQADDVAFQNFSFNFATIMAVMCCKSIRL